MKVGFVGGGNMASAIIGGLVAKGFRAGDMVVSEVDGAARTRLATQLGVRVEAAPDSSWRSLDAVVMAVKPQQMREAATSLHAVWNGSEAMPLVVSIAAGIRVPDLARWLGGHGRIVRVMPNTPALVHAGVTGLFAAPGATAHDRKAAETLMAAVGATLWFENEGDLDAVTAVSGSGPAYVFYAIEALETAARELGLAEGASRSLALWTFVGAAKLAIDRGEDPAILRAQVTSKGGTTERALSVLEQAAVKAHFVDAVKAACERSRELGEAFGKDS